MDLIESYREELQLIRKPWTRFWVSLIVLSVIFLPLFVSDSILYLLTLIFIFSIGVQGQNLLIGYTGLISFGQAGFLAIGAYTFGHLARLGTPLPISLLGGGLFAAIFGVFVGFPSLRLKGPYLAVATLGFGIAVYQILANMEILSGGYTGLTVTKLMPFFGLRYSASMYYFNLILFLLFTLASYNLVSSYIGRAFIAIRDNDIAAEVMGINLTRYKLFSFAISSFYTGLQGGLYALLIGYLQPDMFTFTEGINFLVAVIIGGLASIEGSIFGAVFVVLIPQIFSGYRELVPVILGGTIIIVLVFEPMGLFGRWLKFRLYMKNWPFR
jgi:branched-chain amino acid transport system permease protein